VNIITLNGHMRVNKNQNLRMAVRSALPLAPNSLPGGEIESGAKARRFCDFPGFWRIQQESSRPGGLESPFAERYSNTYGTYSTFPEISWQPQPSHPHRTPLRKPPSP
jgi:hypothetical protein